ncbi:MAG: T9SS type A sorting domain-containing protein, partial [Bacteroidota bacterium]
RVYLQLEMSRSLNVGWRLLDMTGREVASAPTESHLHTYEATLELPQPGLYLLYLQVDGKIFSRKIVRQ